MIIKKYHREYENKPLSGRKYLNTCKRQMTHLRIFKKQTDNPIIKKWTKDSNSK